MWDSLQRKIVSRRLMISARRRYHVDPRERLIEQVLTAHELASRTFVDEDLSGLFDATLTMLQLMVRAVRHRDGALSGHELADRLAVSTPTVSGMVDRLVDRGMLTRSTDDRDRRVRLVALSEAGEQMVTSVHEAGWRIGRDVMERMALEDLQALAQGVQALARAAGNRDRKSTRLNSSHVAISYA